MGPSLTSVHSALEQEGWGFSRPGPKAPVSQSPLVGCYPPIHHSLAALNSHSMALPLFSPTSLTALQQPPWLPAFPDAFLLPASQIHMLLHLQSHLPHSAAFFVCFLCAKDIACYTTLGLWCLICISWWRLLGSEYEVNPEFT